MIWLSSEPENMHFVAAIQTVPAGACAGCFQSHLDFRENRPAQTPGIVQNPLLARVGHFHLQGANLRFQPSCII